MRLPLVMLMGALLAVAAGMQRQEPTNGIRHQPEAGPRFEAVDVFVDSGATPLGAWQVEIKTLAGDVKLVGIEGGAGVYKGPPYYDPAALHENQFQDRIVIAAFSTAAELPVGKTRVARLHIQVNGTEPEYSVKLMAAGAADGNRIEAKATAAPADTGGPGDGR